MSLCSDCISGVRHEGDIEGTFEKIADIDCYIGTPSGDYDKEKVLLYLPDAFGLPLKNNQLLVDDFARNGFKTILVDYFFGNPVPEGADFAKFDVVSWVGSVKPGARGAIDKVVEVLKAQGVTKFAATGYCFGGRYVFDLAFENVIKVAAVSHPSLLQGATDLEKYASQSQAPLLINSCEVDQQFPLEHQAKADEILGEGRFKPGYERTYWEGCHHGFAVRGDISDPKVKAGKEGSFKATVEFLTKYL